MKTSHTLAGAFRNRRNRSDERLVSSFFEKAGMPVVKKRKVTFDAVVISTKGWKFNREAANER
jgi:hypothetical protein